MPNALHTHTAYYNENDSFAADWLEELIRFGMIAPGVVDRRSIEDVKPDDLKGYTQCHFFAGIGGWSLALRLAGWPDDRPIWTGSCPCQPFSSAGKGEGFDDERHLWPAFYWLIEQSAPALVVGEQVAAKGALSWLDLVFDDLEAAGYACWAEDLCAAGIGAPHIRQRLYWMADRSGAGVRGSGRCATAGAPGAMSGEGLQRQRLRHDAGANSDGGLIGLADDNDAGQCSVSVTELLDAAHHAESCGRIVGLGDDDDEGLAFGSQPVEQRRTIRLEGSTPGAPGAIRDFWSAAVPIFCRDGKFRFVEPGIFPLAPRLPRKLAQMRTGILRGAGNSIVPQLAAEFIRHIA